MPFNATTTKSDQLEVAHTAEVENFTKVTAPAEDAAALLAFKSKEERRLVWRQDLIIIPLLSLGYMFGYLV